MRADIEVLVVWATGGAQAAIRAAQRDKVIEWRWRVRLPGLAGAKAARAQSFAAKRRVGVLMNLAANDPESR